MFEKKLPKYKEWLDAIFPQPPLHNVNVNTTSGHVFKNLHNFHINITYVVDPKSIPTLTLLGKVDSS
jgi:hypothetical protein